MSMLAIDARGLSKAYRIGKTRQQVLKNVDFTAYHGQVTMVMGPSGSGKSTLIAALSGLMKPDEGEVRALGESLWLKNPGQVDRFRLAHCGFIFQGFNLFPSLDATEQVVQILRYCGVGKREAHARATAVLESVGLGQRLHQKPAELSGGEKQRVAIARALAKSPSLIFADEPTSALDSMNGQVVIRLLHEAARQRGAAIIVVTHDPRLETHADRIIHMEDGKILDDRMISEPPPHQRTASHGSQT
ncbi:MAG TPA: ABC transporter ATP-binding protein [Steroidobacteraceae bacterium]|nr:ABC transporter ATP-binding protein [Steroidobacteraceae bacterium]